MSEPMQHMDELAEAPPAVVEEFNILMSLALDDLLDDDERAQFDATVAQYPALADQWLTWQTMDRKLHTMPHVEPAAGFTLRFEQRLAHHTQQQQRRIMAVSFIAVMLTAGLGLFGLVSTGAFVLATQGPWLGDQIHRMVLLSVVVTSWLNALSSTVDALANSPQAQVLGLVYVLGVAAMIVAALPVLRRSARLSESVSMPGSE